METADEIYRRRRPVLRRAALPRRRPVEDPLHPLGNATGGRTSLERQEREERYQRRADIGRAETGPGEYGPGEGRRRRYRDAYVPSVCRPEAGRRASRGGRKSDRLRHVSLDQPANARAVKALQPGLR